MGQNPALPALMERMMFNPELKGQQSQRSNLKHMWRRPVKTSCSSLWAQWGQDSLRSGAAGNVALGLSTGWAGPSGPALAILFFFFFRFCVVYYCPNTWSSDEIKSYGTDKNRPWEPRVILGANGRPLNGSHFRNLKCLKIDKVVSEKEERKKEKEIGKVETRNHWGHINS